MARQVPEPASTMEQDRLAALETLHILDTDEDERFDRITELAARLLRAPISLISFVDRDRQWFKSHYGVSITETSRALSFCAVAIERGELYVIEDMLDEPRWHDTELVVNPPRLRSYAGQPLRGPGGYLMGTLNVIDLEPRHFTDEELALLVTLARYAEAELAVHQLARLGAELDATRTELEQANRSLAEAVAKRSAELSASEERFRRLVDRAPDVIVDYQLVPEPRLLYVSPALERITGWSPAEALASDDPIGLVVHPEDRPLLDQVLADPHAVADRSMMLRWRHRDGSTIWTQNRLVAIHDAGGVTVGWEAVVRDVTDLHAAQEELAHRALHDRLTGLPNRDLFTEQLTLLLRNLARHAAAVCVLFFDLDRFKVVNDSLGHATGDELLRAVAQRVAQVLRPGDLLARLGGDEFAILVPDAGSADGAIAVARRVLAAFEAPFVVGTEELYTSASIGVACTDVAESADDLLRHADVAMYRAKAAGRARFEVFDEALRDHLHERIRLEGALHRALDRQELAVLYQPIVELAHGRPVAVEALLRWRRDGVELGPAEFIGLAEETGLIVPIGEWVLARAARDATGWRDPVSGAPLMVQVNLSARQVTSPGLDAAVERALDGALTAERLCLEITESVVMSDMGPAVKVLGRLCERGVRIAVDDFGTGYSSLAYLRRLPVDALKIDRAFVHDIDGPVPDGRLVTAITTMAHTLELQVTAEGVETRAQLAALRACGCEHAQGFLFARPVAAGEVPAALVAASAMVAPA
ncbi:MAG: EAL domain-containing protein [Actinobacteria bacterium]|nr:EAL domain-containing protein [Actinomycetota bacterium]